MGAIEPVVHLALQLRGTPSDKQQRDFRLRTFQAEHQGAAVVGVAGRDLCDVGPARPTYAAFGYAAESVSRVVETNDDRRAYEQYNADDDEHTGRDTEKPGDDGARSVTDEHGAQPRGDHEDRGEDETQPEQPKAGTRVESINGFGPLVRCSRGVRHGVRRLSESHEAVVAD